MDLLQLQHTFLQAGFHREYKLVQISDAHIVCIDADSTPEDVQLFHSTLTHWRSIKRDFAAIYGEFCDERYDIEPCLLLQKLMDHAVHSGAQALLISGDVMETITESALRYLRNLFAAYPLPILFCPGNHCLEDAQDPENLYPKLGTLIPEPEFQTLDMGEFRIIAIDNARKTVSDRVLHLLREALCDPRPILLMMHIPLKLGEFAKKADDLLKDPYWLVDGETCGENAAELLRLVRDNAHRFLAILAGHVHGNVEGAVAPGLMQYTASSALIGQGRTYLVK